MKPAKQAGVQNTGKAAAFQAAAADIAKALRDKIEAECDGFAPDPAASAARAARAQNDFGFFATTYFPHHTRGGAASEFHGWLFGALPAAIEASGGARLVIAAPRGNAKTTYCSQIFVLWCVLTGRKHYVVLLSDATDQAVGVLDGLKAELEVNRRLAMDFPKGVGAGRVWQAACIVTAGGVKLEAFGAAKRLRGRRHGAHRPDLVILDDLENDENVRTPEQRDKLEGWIDKAVEPLGPPDGSMDIIYVGTVLHYDAVLARKLKNKAWESKIFKAVIQKPDRLDLWQKWEEIAHNEGLGAAQNYYNAHAREMEKGAVILWPAVQPLLALMKLRFRIGEDAFNAEYQNDPIDAAAALFKDITFWVQEVRHWVFVGACDPSLGLKAKKRDPSAILIGGYDRDSGVLDVIEAAIARRTPDKIIEDIIAMQGEYHCWRWGIETVQFQAFLMSEIVRRSAVLGVAVPAWAITQEYPKEMRIEGIQTHIKNGLIRLAPGLTVLEGQLRHYPKAENDDGPDCLEMLWRIAQMIPAGAGVLTAPRPPSPASGADFIGGGLDAGRGRLGGLRAGLNRFIGG